MFMCSCGFEGITVDKDDEDMEIYLSCYIESGFYTKQNLLKQIFKRLKIICNILIKGDYKFYEIILTQDTAKDLSHELEMLSANSIDE